MAKKIMPPSAFPPKNPGYASVQHMKLHTPHCSRAECSRRSFEVSEWVTYRDFQLWGHSALLADGCGRSAAIVSHEQYQASVDARRPDEATIRRRRRRRRQKIFSPTTQNARARARTHVESKRNETKRKRSRTSRSVCFGDHGRRLIVRTRRAMKPLSQIRFRFMRSDMKHTST